MREKEEGKQHSGLRRSVEEDLFEDTDDAAVLQLQPLETLRDGYSWTRVLQTRHPGWQMPSVDGFPFTLPAADLSALKVCLVSLAGVYRKGQKPFNTSPGLVSSELRAMRFRDSGDPSLREIPRDVQLEELAISHAHYDHQEADEDISCVFPLLQLQELEVEGIVGECAAAHYSLMGFAPDPRALLVTVRREILPALEAQRVGAALISGGCEISHVCAALIQREIEGAGIPTVSISVCPDITYQLQVPRAGSVRFPMGNPFGASMDRSMQARIVRDALSLLDRVQTPGDVVAFPYEWIRV